MFEKILVNPEGPEEGQTNHPDVKPAFPTCTVTIVQADEGMRLTKRFFVNGAGEVCKDSAPQLTAGMARSVSLPLDELAGWNEQNECLVLGSIKGVPLDESVPLMTKVRLVKVRSTDPRAIARTKDSFAYAPDRAHYAFIDHDPNDDTLPRVPKLTLDELLDKILTAWPGCGLDKAACVYQPSSSAGVRLASGTPSDPRDPYRGSAHISLAFAPGLDPERWMKTLYAYLIEAGEYHAHVSCIGYVTVRTLIDSVVAQPCRVRYSAPAVLESGVERDEPQPCGRRWARPGGYVEVDPSELMSDEEIDHIGQRARHELMRREPVRARVEARREAWRAEAIQRGLNLGLPREEAERRAQDMLGRADADGEVTLHATDLIDVVLDDGRTVSVGDLLDDMQAGLRTYDQAGCADLDSGKPRKAMIYYQPKKPARMDSQLRGWGAGLCHRG